jgi:hypothetical protein
MNARAAAIVMINDFTIFIVFKGYGSTCYRFTRLSLPSKLPLMVRNNVSTPSQYVS